MGVLGKVDFWGVYVTKKTHKNPALWHGCILARVGAIGPVSFTNNYTTTGGKRTELSLALKSKNGLFDYFWADWIKLLSNGRELNMDFYINFKQQQELRTKSVIQHKGNQFLIVNKSTASRMTIK